MDSKVRRNARILTASIASILAVQGAKAQEPEDELLEVVVTGTRVANRSSLELSLIHI